jgi:hypothetical protein
MDISGKVVYSNILEKGDKTHSIDLQPYREGIYLIRIRNAEYTITKKVIKVE